MKSTSFQQRTLQKAVSFSGIGIHTGELVTMRFSPAEEGTGIVFRRTDLPGMPVIPATVEYVCDTARSTTIGIGPVRIHTVEHVLAAISAYQIHNLCIEIDNIEPVTCANGSSDVFVRMIEDVGIAGKKDLSRSPRLILPFISRKATSIWSPCLVIISTSATASAILKQKR